MPMRPFFHRLLYPKPPVLSALVLAAAALLVASLGGYAASPVVVYGSYLFSTYALVALCLAAPGALRAVKRRGARRLEALAGRNARAGRLIRGLADGDARMRTMLPFTLAMNLAYAAFKLAAAAFYRSTWLGAIGAYYAALSLVRFGLVRQAGRASPADERRACRLAALAMGALTLAMGIIITLVVIENRSYDYAGVMIYAFALYAFVRVISAAAAYVKNRRAGSEAMALARSLSLACAMMSVMALQTALLSRFGEDAAYARAFNALTGLGVTVVMLALSVAPLVRQRREGG